MHFLDYYKKPLKKRHSNFWTMLDLSASEEAKAWMFTEELARVCLRIPSAWEFVDGIHPWSTDQELAKGETWEVPKAIAAEQFFYLNQLSDHINDGRDGYFTAAYPDLTPGIDGQRDMTWSQWHDLKGALRLQDTVDFVKHLVNLHNGEARVLRGTRGRVWDAMKQRLYGISAAGTTNSL